MIIRNFLFHRVSEEIDSLWPPMKPGYFARIIEYLTRHYQVVPLENYLSDPSAFTTGKKLATVLFDDGYKDNIEYAAPVLQRFNCPASFYAVTDCIDKNIPTWTYLIDNAFQQTKKPAIELDMDFVPEKFKRVAIHTQAGSVVKQIKPWMKGLTNKQRLQVLDAVLAQCNDVMLPGGKMMIWDEIRQLSSAGFIIGSHSHTHPMLASLADEKEISDELTISFAKITAEVGKKPLSISYPIGSYDERVKNIAAACGYKYGLAVEQQFYKVQKDNLFAIPRVELYQEPWWKTRARMSGLYSSIRQLWK